MALVSRRSAVPALLVAGQALLQLSTPAAAFELKQESFEDLARLSVPAQWTRAQAADPSSVVFFDPVAGQTLRYLAITSRPTAAAAMGDLGRVESVDFARVLGLRPELARADMIAAAVRTGEGAGEVFYDWDLATAPKQCGADVQYLVGTCPYDQIVLLSATVSRGRIIVLEMVADAAQWKQNGVALRALRQSFATQ